MLFYLGSKKAIVTTHLNHLRLAGPTDCEQTVSCFVYSWESQCDPLRRELGRVGDRSHLQLGLIQ